MEFAHIVLLILAVAFVIKLGYLWHVKHHRRSHRHYHSHHHDS